MTFWRITFIYIMSLTFISLLVPCTSGDLIGGSYDANTSPLCAPAVSMGLWIRLMASCTFCSVLVFKYAGVSGIPDLINATITVSVLSSMLPLVMPLPLTDNIQKLACRASLLALELFWRSPNKVTLPRCSTTLIKQVVLYLLCWSFCASIQLHMPVSLCNQKRVASGNTFLILIQCSRKRKCW